MSTNVLRKSVLRSVITYSFHHFCFLARTQKRLIRQCFVSLTLILLITFSSTQTQKCLTEGTVHSLTTYFSLYFFPTYTQRSFNRCSACSVTAWVCMFVWRVQIFYHIFLSTVYHSFSSAFHHSFSFFPHIHTHSYLHFPPSYTHSHIHINFITKICKFPMNTLTSFTYIILSFLLPTYHNFLLRDM